MTIDAIHTQIQRDVPLQPRLDNPEIIEKLRHGNIYEILRSQINHEDFNKFVNFQGKRFENEILQNYQVFADGGSVPAPDLNLHFSSHNLEMSMGSEDRRFFQQEMAGMRARAMSLGGAKSVRTDEPQGPGQVEMTIAQGARGEWEEFFGEFQNRVMGAQMVQQMRAKGEELNRDIQRIIAMVMSGQVDPEYVLIAAAKSNMAQNGVMFSWKGKKILHLNEQMNAISKELYKMDAGDPNYPKELQLSQSMTRDFSSTMQMETMDLQSISQSIASTLEFANNAVRTFSQMRQTPTQAIAARG